MPGLNVTPLSTVPSAVRVFSRSTTMGASSWRSASTAFVLTAFSAPGLHNLRHQREENIGVGHSAAEVVAASK